MFRTCGQKHSGQALFEDETICSTHSWSVVCLFLLRPMMVLILCLGPGDGGFNFVPIVTFGAMGGCIQLAALLLSYAAARRRELEEQTRRLREEEVHGSSWCCYTVSPAVGQAISIMADGLLLALAHPAVQHSQWENFQIYGGSSRDPPCWHAMWTAWDTHEEACDTLTASAVSTTVLQAWMSLLIIMVYRVRASCCVVGSVLLYCFVVVGYGGDVHTSLLWSAILTVMMVLLAKWRMEISMLDLCDAWQEIESLRDMATVGKNEAGLRPTFERGPSRGPMGTKDITDIFHKSISHVMMRSETRENDESPPSDGKKPTSRFVSKRSGSRLTVMSRTHSSANTDVTGLTCRTFNSSVAFESTDLTDLDVTKVKRLGRQEHWLVGVEDLDVHEDQILGKGGFGSVRAGHLQGTPCAIKLAHGVDLSEREHKAMGLKQLVNELRIMRHIRHPNIVLFHGACMDMPSNKLALVLEQVEGCDLQRWIKGGDNNRTNSVAAGQSYGYGHNLGTLKIAGGPGPNPGEPRPEARIRILLGICRALRYLHSRTPPVVHGDLKPSNIMVEAHPLRPRTKLLDFGLSRLIKEKSEPLGGTVRWCAPEIFEAVRPDPAADSFSFGRVTYLVATNRTPFGGTEQREVQKLLTDGTPLQWPNRRILTRARPLADTCMSYNPEQRPEMRKVQEELEEWLIEQESCDMSVSSGDVTRQQTLDSAATTDGVARTSTLPSRDAPSVSKPCVSMTVEL